MVILGTSGFNEKLTAINYDIMGQESTITDAKERLGSIEGVDDPVSVKEHKAEQDLQKSEDRLKEFGGLVRRDCHSVGGEGEAYPW